MFDRRATEARSPGWRGCCKLSLPHAGWSFSHETQYDLLLKAVDHRLGEAGSTACATSR